MCYNLANSLRKGKTLAVPDAFLGLNTLILTKLNVPQTGGELIERPRLLARLNNRSNRKATLISAPAGFGKTGSLPSSGLGGYLHTLGRLLDSPISCYK